MQIIVKGGLVVATHDDGVISDVVAAYGAGATVQQLAAGQPVPALFSPAPEVSLAALQTSLSTDINEQAEAQRLKYVAPGACQMATYLLKRSQALGALTAQTANTAANMTADALAMAYPYLANEIGITVDPTSKAPATDIYGVARAVSAVSAVWQPLDIAIEKVRLATNVAIAAAITVATAQAAHDAAAWPAPPSA